MYVGVWKKILFFLAEKKRILRALFPTGGGAVGGDGGVGGKRVVLQKKYTRILFKKKMCFPTSILQVWLKIKKSPRMASGIHPPPPVPPPMWKIFKKNNIFFKFPNKKTNYHAFFTARTRG
jgi:hypothetical protein